MFSFSFHGFVFATVARCVQAVAALSANPLSKVAMGLLCYSWCTDWHTNLLMSFIFIIKGAMLWPSGSKHCIMKLKTSFLLIVSLLTGTCNNDSPDLLPSTFLPCLLSILGCRVSSILSKVYRKISHSGHPLPKNHCVLLWCQTLFSRSNCGA